ncbi:MAG: hypothetical protein IMF07_08320 [Proteobacteria bacterium]|nr:hypothetical protein [Pseudomonadota bacterium]
MEYSTYEPHIDFIYTTLLMLWGGSCVGIGAIAVPYIYKHMDSITEASNLTSRILKRQDILIRVIALCMLLLFYFKSKLPYSYERIEWVAYVAVLHFYIFGKVISKRLWKLREKVENFDTPIANDPHRIRFKKWHIVGRMLYYGQIAGVVMLLYMHAFGLKAN